MAALSQFQENFNEVRDFLLQHIKQMLSEKRSEKLPSENQLADYFNIPRTTVRQVYQQLIELGYIESKQGVGHFARQTLPQIDLMMKGDQSFSEKMLEQGLDYQSVQLGVLVEEERFIFRRLRLINQIPVAIHHSYLPKALFPDFDQQIGEETSLFSFLRKAGYQHFDSTYSLMSISMPSAEEQILLYCGSLVPLVRIEANCIDADTKQELENSHIIYRSDIVNFNLAKD